MKICSNCGKQLTEEALFCPNCGQKYEPPQEDPPQQGGFCPNCGERVARMSGFCPNCGKPLGNTAAGQSEPAPAAGPAPAAEPAPAAGPAPQVKRSHNRTVGIVAAAAVVAVIAVAAVKLLGGGSPAKEFVRYQQGMLLDTGKQAITKVGDLLSVPAKISTDLCLTASTDDYEANSVLDEAALNLQLDVDENKLALGGNMVIGGSPVLSGVLNYDSGRLGFCLPELEPTYYTADLVRVLDSDPDYRGLANVLREPPKIELPTKELTGLLETYGGVLLETMNDENVSKTEDTNILLEYTDEVVRGDLYTFEPDVNDVEQMLLRLADALEQDKNLPGLLSWLEDTAEVASALDADLISVEDLEELLDAAADELRSSARVMAEDLIDYGGFRWILGVSDNKVCLERLVLEDGDAEFGFERTDGSILLYTASYGSADNLLLLEYDKEGKTYSGSLTYDDYYDSITLYFEDLDPETRSALGICYGSWSLFYDGSGILFQVEEGEEGGTDHTLGLIGFSDSDLGDTYLTLHSSDRKATISVPNHVEELDITDDLIRGDVYDLLSTLSEGLDDLYFQLMGSDYYW